MGDRQHQERKEASYRSSVTEKDVDRVRDIVLSSGFFNDEEISVAVELIEDRVSKGERSDYQFLFAEINGEAVAYSCFGRILGTLASYDFYWIAVDNRCRGHGIGRRLMAATEQAIRSAGGHRIYVETSSREQYEPTRRFYLACGYRVEATIEDFYAPGDSKVILLKLV